MKRNLIIVASAALVLGTTVVRASEFPFDDPYWKRAETAHSVQSIQSVHTETAAPQSRGAYDLVDNYNP